MAISPAHSALSSPLPQKPALELLEPRTVPASTTALRLAFWSVGILLASAQAWIFRYEVSADSISYFDMSDGLLGSGWHRLINGVYSVLYPFLLGGFRRLFHISPGEEIPAAHAFGVVLFIFHDDERNRRHLKRGPPILHHKEGEAQSQQSSFATRQSLLRTLASQGAKVVIATSPVLTAENRSEWSRLGATPYWVWRPVSQ